MKSRRCAAPSQTRRPAAELEGNSHAQRERDRERKSVRFSCSYFFFFFSYTCSYPGVLSSVCTTCTRLFFARSTTLLHFVPNLFIRPKLRNFDTTATPRSNTVRVLTRGIDYHVMMAMDYFDLSRRNTWQWKKTTDSVLLIRFEFNC